MNASCASSRAGYDSKRSEPLPLGNVPSAFTRGISWRCSGWSWPGSSSFRVGLPRARRGTTVRSPVHAPGRPPLLVPPWNGERARGTSAAWLLEIAAGRSGRSPRSPGQSAIRFRRSRCAAGPGRSIPRGPSVRDGGEACRHGHRRTAADATTRSTRSKRPSQGPRAMRARLPASSIHHAHRPRTRTREPFHDHPTARNTAERSSVCDE